MIFCHYSISVHLLFISLKYDNVTLQVENYVFPVIKTNICSYTCKKQTIPFKHWFILIIESKLENICTIMHVINHK